MEAQLILRQRLADVCVLLVKYFYGELSSRIFETIISNYELSLPRIVQSVKLPTRYVSHALVALIQQNLVLCWPRDNSSTTLYQANFKWAYELIRSGKHIELARSRYGDEAAKVVSDLQYLGNAREVELLPDIASKVTTKGDKGKQKASNGPDETVRSGVGSAKDPVDLDEAGKSSKDATLTPLSPFVVLKDSGFLERVGEFSHVCDLDFDNVVQAYVKRKYREFRDSTAGSKKGPRFRSLVDSKKAGFLESFATFDDIQRDSIPDGESTVAFESLGSELLAQIAENDAARDDAVDGSHIDPAVKKEVSHESGHTKKSKSRGKKNAVSVAQQATAEGPPVDPDAVEPVAEVPTETPCTSESSAKAPTEEAVLDKDSVNQANSKKGPVNDDGPPGQTASLDDSDDGVASAKDNVSIDTVPSDKVFESEAANNGVTEESVETAKIPNLDGTNDEDDRHEDNDHEDVNPENFKDTAPSAKVASKKVADNETANEQAPNEADAVENTAFPEASSTAGGKDPHKKQNFESKGAKLTVNKKLSSKVDGAHADEAFKHEQQLYYRLNPSKLLVSYRTDLLTEFARTRIGDNFAKVYKCVLLSLEAKLKWIRNEVSAASFEAEDDEDDIDKDHEEDDEVQLISRDHTISWPSTRDVLRRLDAETLVAMRMELETIYADAHEIKDVVDDPLAFIKEESDDDIQYPESDDAEDVDASSSEASAGAQEEDNDVEPGSSKEKSAAESAVKSKPTRRPNFEQAARMRRLNGHTNASRPAPEPSNQGFDGASDLPEPSNLGFDGTSDMPESSEVSITGTKRKAKKVVIEDDEDDSNQDTAPAKKKRKGKQGAESADEKQNESAATAVDVQKSNDEVDDSQDPEPIQKKQKGKRATNSTNKKQNEPAPSAASATTDNAQNLEEEEEVDDNQDPELPKKKQKVKEDTKSADKGKSKPAASAAPATANDAQNVHEDDNTRASKPAKEAKGKKDAKSADEKKRKRDKTIAVDAQNLDNDEDNDDAEPSKKKQKSERGDKSADDEKKAKKNQKPAATAEATSQVNEAQNPHVVDDENDESKPETKDLEQLLGSDDSEDQNIHNLSDLEVVNRYLTIIAQDPTGFLYEVAHTGSRQWNVPFEKIVSALAQLEIDRAVQARFGLKAVTVLHILAQNGQKLLEQQVCDRALMNPKELRPIATQLMAAGYILIQEVPKDKARVPKSIVYLMYYNFDRTRSFLIDDIYFSMIHLLQRLDAEKAKVQTILDKAASLALPGMQKRSLNAVEKEKKKAFEKKEQKVLAQLARLDDLVMLWRDFLPPVGDAGVVGEAAAFKKVAAGGV